MTAGDGETWPKKFTGSVVAWLPFQSIKKQIQKRMMKRSPSH